MSKVVCTCKNDKYINNGTSSFFLFPKFNNKYVKESFNPHDFIKRQGQNNSLNTNRINNSSCYAPFRMPYNHTRKKSTCDTGCITNEKIIKDVPSNTSIEEDASCASTACRRKNYASSRLVNSIGIRNYTQGSNYKNTLQFSGKLYNQNASGLLNENA